MCVKMVRKFLLCVAGFVLAVTAAAQDFAVKTNLLYDATATVNAGVEIGIAPRWSLDLSGNYNAWRLEEDSTWKHWMAQPELRFWMCDRFSGHFVAFHGVVGQYNIGGIKNSFSFLGTDFFNLTDFRYQGWAAGGGVAYGYAWILSRYLNLEAEIGVGVIYTQYDKFNCVGCGKRVVEGQPHQYVGPTKAAISLVYVF